MNESEQIELQRLKQRHERLESEISQLREQLASLESKLIAAPSAESCVAPPDISAAAIPEPPVIEEFVSQLRETAETPVEQFVATPEPIPESSATSSHAAVEVSAGDGFSALTTQSIPESAPPYLSPPPPVATAPTKASFEMRLGTYWFVRIGVVLVVTALAFLANYTYQNYIGKLGAPGKISLLYFASGLLLVAGLWWQRKAATNSLRNYAQVLFAGGLAAVYFTTYAAHHIEHLRVIESALLDGILLSAWAAFIGWIADRKKSELLAFFAVGLAYYTSLITQVGNFTLYSNFVLTLAAVGFLVRNRWVVLSSASLFATYGSYAFWRFYNGSTGWHFPTADQSLWFGAAFLFCYWLVFTTAVFFSKHPKFVGANRATFLTLNNGAFLALFLLTMFHVRAGGFWKVSLGYGSALLALSLIARRVLRDDRPTQNSYLTQGLVLVTIGFIAHPKLAGLNLALVLAAESVVLFYLSTLRKNLIVELGSYTSGAMALAWSLDGIHAFDSRGLWLGSALGAMMLFNSFWSHRQRPATQPSQFRLVPGYFSALALMIWFFTTWQNVTHENIALVLTLEGLLLTASIYILRIPEVALLAQSLVLGGHALWQINLATTGSPSWWNSLAIIAMTLALGHWWQKQKTVVADARTLMGFQFGLSLLMVLLVCAWCGRDCQSSTWLALSCLLAVGVTIYAAAMRQWMLAICAQIFLLPAGWLFLMQVGQGHGPKLAALAPIAAFGLLSFSAVRWFRARPDANPETRETILKLSLGYRWVALAMSLWWVLEYIPRDEQIWTLTLIGGAIFAVAGWMKNREPLLFSAAFSVVAAIQFAVRAFETDFIYAPTLLAVLAWLAQQQIARRVPQRFAIPEQIHTSAIVFSAIALWIYITRWVNPGDSGFFLTASWSALALLLLVCGIAMRERMYRWSGLVILTCALGRVVIFDVWKLETIYRILSFAALGIVLLVLGFIYNKYQEKLRQWL